MCEKSTLNLLSYSNLITGQKLKLKHEPISEGLKWFLTKGKVKIESIEHQTEINE